MADTKKTDIIEAFNRVLAARKNVLRSKNNWRVLAEVPKTTALDAFAGRNPTVETLEKLAKAAGMTVAEMLEYGDPEWEWRIAARALLQGMSKQEVTALAVLLRKQEAKLGAPAETGAPSASEG